MVRPNYYFRSFTVLAVVAAGLLMLLVMARPAHAATFTVNKTGDKNDLDFPGGTFDGSSDGRCDSSTRRGRQCTLRAAIQEANETDGADTINFNIGGTASVKTISPASPLPTITEAVTINGYSQPGASANTNTTLAQGTNAVLKIQLNGTNAGAAADGLKIEASNSTIKGLVINRFAHDGIFITGPSATGNKVEGNFIGTNAAGSTDRGNDNDGVRVVAASNNTIGGTAAEARNVISGNDQSGVLIFASSATDNKVQGNFIGTNAAGSTNLGNNDGVDVVSAPDNTIGGTVAGAGNLISGNITGVFIGGSSATGNKVEDNTIRNNGDNGVLIIFSAADNAIEGNQIFANDLGDGVRVQSGTGNSVLSNQIFANGGLGIDLDPNGVTNNDTDDPDTGANNLQNFPVITSATRSTTSRLTTISGTLNSNPSQSFTVQCFVADDDPSGHGEGLVFLTEDTTVSTDDNGDASFSCVTSLRREVGQTVSATATNQASGDTSEFSQRVVISPGP